MGEPEAHGQPRLIQPTLDVVLADGPTPIRLVMLRPGGQCPALGMPAPGAPGGVIKSPACYTFVDFYRNDWEGVAALGAYKPGSCPHMGLMRSGGRKHDCHYPELWHPPHG